MQIRHKKSLGQNFLKDRLILERIVDSSEINPTDDVYEIGPGDGALTEFLFRKVNSITAYEIDRSLVPILNKRFQEKHLEIVNIDVLNANLEEISNNNSVIVGNLPYNVSSQIILKILESKIKFKHCIFMVQKEMANRFILNHAKASKLSLLAKLRADIEELFEIPPEAFNPTPKVTSSLIKITPHQIYSQDFDTFKFILTVAFANPRKKISYPLKALFKTIPKFSFSLDLRPEDLALNDYFEILEEHEKQI